MSEPIWTGVKFTCKGRVKTDRGVEQCGAEYQLEAGDVCVLRLVLNDHLETDDAPPCIDCGHVNVIGVDRAAEVGGS